MSEKLASVKSVGIFAGTFDPIHLGHLEVAKLSISECSLDRVFFAVEEHPWGNKQPVNVSHRSKMVELAIKDQDKIFRLELPHKHFDIDHTLPYLETKFENQKLFFIFGADVFMGMNQAQWPNLNKLTKHHIIVFERGNFNDEDIQKHAKDLDIKVAILPTKHLNYSSSKFKNEGSINLLPKDVKNYISVNGLYLTKYS